MGNHELVVDYMVWLFVETTSHREERGQSRLHPQGAIERGRDCLAIFILKFEQHVQDVVEFEMCTCYQHQGRRESLPYPSF